MKNPVREIIRNSGYREPRGRIIYWELFQLSLNAWLMMLGMSPDNEKLISFIKYAALCEPRGKGRENLGNMDWRFFVGWNFHKTFDICNCRKYFIFLRQNQVFTSIGGVDYTPDIRKRIRLLPPDTVIDAWRSDYNDMQTSMIYGEKSTFEDLMSKMKELEEKFHNH